MKKRIVRIEKDFDTCYMIQTRFLWMWWDDVVDYLGASLRVTYKTLEECENKLREESSKEFITVVKEFNSY